MVMYSMKISMVGVRLDPMQALMDHHDRPHVGPCWASWQAHTFLNFVAPTSSSWKISLPIRSSQETLLQLRHPSDHKRLVFLELRETPKIHSISIEACRTLHIRVLINRSILWAKCLEIVCLIGAGNFAAQIDLSCKFKKLIWNVSRCFQSTIWGAAVSNRSIQYTLSHNQGFTNRGKFIHLVPLARFIASKWSA